MTVTFKSAFALPGWDEPLPAGQYTVTTDEEQLDTSFPAFHRVATRIELRKGAVTQFLTISPRGPHGRSDQGTPDGPAGLRRGPVVALIWTRLGRIAWWWISQLRGPTGAFMDIQDRLHPLWEVGSLRLALHAAGVALWSWNVDDDRITMDEQAFRLWGVPQSDEVTFEDLSSHIHPADRDRVRAAFTATRAVVGAYEIDFRIMLGDRIR